MSDAIKSALADPDVRQRRIEAQRQPEVRLRRSQSVKRALSDPRVRERISKGLKGSWTTERRLALGSWARNLWDVRKATLQVAGRRPLDWWDRPIMWRIIGDVLLSRDGSMSNRELGKALDAAHLIQCPYTDAWNAALSSNIKAKSNAATALVAKIRRWVKKPGSSGRARVAVTHFLQSEGS